MSTDTDPLQTNPVKGFLDPTHLFPCPFRTGFTTAPRTARLDLPPNVTRIPLDSSSSSSSSSSSYQLLNITKVTGGLSREIAQDPPLTDRGTQAWTAVYPEGSINPNNKNAPKGGFGLYVGGPSAEGSFFGDAREILLSYAVYFEPGFEFARGGKLPGPYGGATPDIAYGCSGGRQDDRDQCFSLRLMWRRNGDGEIYAYLPNAQENTDVLLRVPPRSERNPDYGFSVGRGAWRFVAGQWTVLAQRVKLNDVGQANGEIDLWANGEKVISASGIVIRQDERTVFRGAHFQTFFGGNTREWASPKTQTALVANVSGAIIQ